MFKICALLLFLCSLSPLSFAIEEEGSLSSASTSEHQRVLNNFFNAVELIKKNYVQPVSEEKLYENALRGMVNGLDPHSSYLDSDDLTFLTDTTSGKYVGVGLELTQEKHITKIISALDDSPGKAANIQPGDILLKINSTSVERMSLQEIIKKMQGPENTSLTLTLYRKGQNEPFTVKIIRKSIKLKSVKAQLLKPHYGYIRIAYFQERTPEETQQAITNLQQLSDRKLDGLVIDLRNNPGGLLDSAINVSDLFIGGHKPIVSAKGRTPESKFAVNSTATDIINNTPIVILINGGSASGAEIMAGALQDYHRAIIMGETSFGKGSVQTVIPLSDTSGLKLTTSLYYTPSGRSIQAKGIVPDVKISNKILSDASNNHDDDFSIKESELPGHLLSGKETASAEQSAFKDPQAQAILASDYQVQEALQLLEGLNVTHKTP
ncbi:MAG: S41 family peptidase [Gammaproteobacteria bacterium]|nr:S41 family peptidase [Gammaproteobacteria bacterium]